MKAGAHFDKGSRPTSNETSFTAQNSSFRRTSLRELMFTAFLQMSLSPYSIDCFKVLQYFFHTWSICKAGSSAILHPLGDSRLGQVKKDQAYEKCCCSQRACQR